MDAFKRALRLLNYTDIGGETDAAAAGELYKRGLAVTDQICADVAQAEQGQTPPSLTSLSAPLPLSSYAARQVVPYGIAMLLAAGRGDGDNQQLFAALYTQKRRGLGRGQEQRADRLPRGVDT
jgi:hypothetical protein